MGKSATLLFTSLFAISNLAMAKASQAQIDASVKRLQNVMVNTSMKECKKISAALMLIYEDDKSSNPRFLHPNVLTNTCVAHLIDQKKTCAGDYAETVAKKEKGLSPDEVKTMAEREQIKLKACLEVAYKEVMSDMKLAAKNPTKSDKMVKFASAFINKQKKQK